MAGYASAAFAPAAAALYVGDLDPSVNDQNLMVFFSQFPAVVSVRVCRDRVTKKSLRYAYVNFSSKPEAAKAMKALNHKLLNSRPVRIMWSLRDPNTRKHGVGNVFVKNLHISVEETHLEEIFGTHGEVMSCKVARESDGKSKCYGFVQFLTEESARAAIDALHESAEIFGKKLYVYKFVPKRERPTPEFPKHCTLFIKNFEESITEDILRKNFSKFGEIRNIKIVRDREGKSKGFGYISFEKADDAAEAIAEMNRARIGTKMVYVGEALAKSERVKFLINLNLNTEIFVKNLHPSVGENELREIFGGCGRIRSAKVIFEGNVSRGFGFVRFSTPDEAKTAISSFNGIVYKGSPLYVDMAKGKEPPRADMPYNGTGSLWNQAFLVPQAQQMWMNGYYHPAYPYYGQPALHYGNRVPASWQQWS